MKSTWPEADLNKVDKKAISDMQLIQGIVTAVRTVKSEMNVPPSKTVDVIINNVKSEETKKILEKYVSYLKSLARIENVQVGSALTLSAFVQYESWLVPLLAPAAKDNVTTALQMTYWPRHWRLSK